MIQETSYGIIPLRKQDGVWNVLLVNHHSGGHWSFPKGHAEPGENAKETAVRELYEETGQTIVRFLSEKPLEETYQFFARGGKVIKTVNYFLAEVQGNVVLQSKEIADSKWVPLSQASDHVTFKEAKSLCRKAISLLEGDAR